MSMSTSTKANCDLIHYKSKCKYSNSQLDAMMPCIKAKGMIKPHTSLLALENKPLPVENALNSQTNH